NPCQILFKPTYLNEKYIVKINKVYLILTPTLILEFIKNNNPRMTKLVGIYIFGSPSTICPLFVAPIINLLKNSVKVKFEFISISSLISNATLLLPLYDKTEGSQTIEEIPPANNEENVNSINNTQVSLNLPFLLYRNSIADAIK